MSQPEQGRRIREGNNISRRVNFGNDMLDGILLGPLVQDISQKSDTMSGCQSGKRYEGWHVDAQTYLLHFQDCLTFETHDAPSLPGACFQGHKDYSGKWHTGSFCPTLAPFCLGSGFLLLCPLLPAAPIPPACFPRAAEPARQCALVFSLHPCSANLLDYSNYI